MRHSGVSAFVILVGCINIQSAPPGESSGSNSTGSSMGGSSTGGSSMGSSSMGSSSMGSSSSGSDSAGSGSNGSAGSNHGPSIVTLALDASSLPGVPAGYQLGTGDYLLELDITLTNNTSASITADPAELAITTSLSNLYNGIPASITSPCAGEIVSPGEQHACSLLYELASSEHAELLTFHDTQGDLATVPVPALPNASPSCTKLDADLSNQACVECLEGSAVANCAFYSSACQGSTTCGDSTLFCTCEAMIDDAACRSEFEQSLACEAVACGSACN